VGMKTRQPISEMCILVVHTAMLSLRRVLELQIVIGERLQVLVYSGSKCGKKGYNLHNKGVQK